jgi:hypothetical protein
VELHLVHFNTKYGEDLAEAIAKGNGAQDTLAVLGVLFKVQLGKPNEKLEPILKGRRRDVCPSTAASALTPNLLSSHRRDQGAVRPHAHDAVPPARPAPREHRVLLPLQRVSHHARVQRDRRLDRVQGKHELDYIGVI